MAIIGASPLEKLPPPTSDTTATSATTVTTATIVTSVTIGNVGRRRSLEELTIFQQSRAHPRHC
nr:hypothetical protein [Ktedonobacteraceae bacterium]